MSPSAIFKAAMEKIIEIEQSVEEVDLKTKLDVAIRRQERALKFLQERGLLDDFWKSK